MLNPFRPKTGKVFGIGLSRTGVTSLTQAMKILGMNAVQFPTNEKTIRNIDAATDTPVAYNFKRLDKLFPHSKFILTVRDPDSWLQSCEKLWRRQAAFFDRHAFVTDLHEKLYGGRTFDRARFLAAYEAHVADTHAHFKERTEDFLELDILKTANPWSPLCRFLGASMPDVPFPNTNDTCTLRYICRRIVNHFGQPAASDLTSMDAETIDQLASVADDDAGEALQIDGGAWTPGWEAEIIIRNLVAHTGSIEKTAGILGLSAFLLQRFI
jgi:hypothetical protein